MEKTQNTRRKRFSSYFNYGPVTAVAVTIASFAFAFILVGFFLGIAIEIFALAQDKSFEELFDSVQNSPGFGFISNALAYIAMAATIYVFMRFRKVRLSEVGLGRKPALRDFGYALITFVPYFITLVVVTAVVGGLIPGIDIDQEQQLGFEPGIKGAGLILVFISLVVIPPLVEEFIDRGFLYSGLRRGLAIIPAAIITSLIFAIPHLQPGSGEPLLYIAAIDTFILSFFLIGLREKTGSIWSGIFMHGIKNALAFTLLFVVGVS